MCNNSALGYAEKRGGRFGWVTILLIAVLLSEAAQKTRVTVIPFNSIDLSKSDAQSMTLLFEASLQDTGVFTLIEQVEATSILAVQEYSRGDCMDELCAIEIGRLLSVDRIVLGTVGKVADQYYVMVKIIDVQTGRHLGAKKIQDSSLSELVKNFDSVAHRFTGEEGDGPESNKIVQLDLAEGKYEGQVKGGLPHGQGTLYSPNGDRYVGEHRNGDFSGQGTYYFSDTGPFAGNRYEGEFRDNRPTGQGTFYSKSGDVYTGKWAAGNPIGGSLVRPDGSEKWVTDWWF